MNKILKFMPIACLATMALTISSCSDEKDEPTLEPTPGEETAKVDPKTVFSEGLPKGVGDMVITTNAEGLVTKIVDDDVVTTFDYNGSAQTKSRATITIPTDYDMVINVNDDGDDYVFYATLNDMGYITYAYEVEVGNDDDGTDTAEEWWFKYNANGQLIEMKRTEGNNEVTTMEYDSNGDIVKVTCKDDDGDDSECTILYTDATHSSPIANKSGIMLYDYSLRVDMDEMAPAYFAGLLGKGTTNLPLSAKEVQDDTTEYTFTWTLNSNQMPTKFESVAKSQWGDYTDTIDIKW